MEILSVERTLTELDHARLKKLVHSYKCGKPVSSAALPIERVLDEAGVVAWHHVPPDVITMRSRALLRDLQTGTERRVTLCYPDESDADKGFVSVLSSLGWNLLGHRAGHTVRWATPSGATLAAEIVGVLFQPASSGVLAK